MKKLVLYAFWLPINLSLLTFSFAVLLKYTPPKNHVQTQNAAFAQELIWSTPSPPPVNSLMPPQTDMRISVLEAFFRKYNSPLVEVSSHLVDTADRWGLDYALIPAISMQESGGCKVIPVDSFNCWGFGIYGKTVTRFSSYEQAISQVAKTIKETYIKKGLTNPTLLENIWAPQSTGQWSYAVNYFIGKIRDLEKNIPAT